MLYKILHGLVEVSTDYFRRSDSRTRGQKRFFQERVCNEAYSKSFFPRTIREWNQLPSHITSAETLEAFKTGLTAGPVFNRL